MLYPAVSAMQEHSFMTLTTSVNVMKLSFFINDATGNLASVKPGNTKGGSIIVPLTSCLTGLESAV